MQTDQTTSVLSPPSLGDRKASGLGANTLSGQWPEATIVAALMLLVLLCYGNILANGFVYDDEQQILQNPYVKDWRFLPQIFGTTVWSFVGQAGTTNYYRPLMTFSFLVLWKLFGPIPFGFHLFSILVHAAVVIMIFYAGFRIFRDRRIAWMAAVLFAIHPIHTEAVDWIAALPDLEATFFILLALWVLTKPGPMNWKQQLLLLSSFSLALLSKEPALMFAPLAIAFEHGVSYDKQVSTLVGKATRYAPLCLLGLTYLVLRILLFGKIAPVLQHPKLTWPQAFYSALSLVLTYIRMLVWPFGLSAFHVFHASTYLLEPRVLSGLTIVLFCAVSVLLLFKKQPSLAFAILWIGVTLAPVLNARWMAANVQTERYLYLPSVGFCWLVAGCAARFWDSQSNLRSNYRKIRLAALVVAVAVAFIFVVMTIRRNAEWQTDLKLYTDTLKSDPDAAVIRSNLGGIYFAMGDYANAGQEWERALADKPDNVVTMNALGILYTQEGKYAHAREMFQRAITAKPLWGTAHCNYGLLLQKTGEPDHALEEFKTAVQLSPLDATGRRRYGEALLTAGRVDAAEAQLKEAVDLEPSLEGLRSLTQVYLQMERYEEAEAVLRRMVKEYPIDSAAHFQLARLLEMFKQFDDARREYLEGLKTDAANAEAKSAIQRIEQQQGKHTQAPQ